MKPYFLPVLVALTLVSCASTPVKRNFSEVVDDAVISNRLKIKLLSDSLVSGLNVNVDTYKGVVSLKGQVSNQQQIDKAISIAERENGVKEVKSYLYLDQEKNKNAELNQAKDKNNSLKRSSDNALVSGDNKNKKIQEVDIK